MSLEYVYYGLQIIGAIDGGMDGEQVREMLRIDEADLVFSERKSRTQFFLLVNFPPVELDPRSETAANEDDLRHERFGESVVQVHARLAQWISSREETLNQLRDSGMTLRLVGNLWISENQIDIALSSSLALACGNAGIEIYLISNE